MKGMDGKNGFMFTKFRLEGLLCESLNLQYFITTMGIFGLHDATSLRLLCAMRRLSFEYYKIIILIISWQRCTLPYPPQVLYIRVNQYDFTTSSSLHLEL